MILVVAPNPTVDVTYEVDGLRPGSTNRVTAARERAGGKPLNVARALRALGHDVTVVGFATDDLVPTLPDGRWIPVPGRARRTIAVVDRAADEVTSLNEPGPVVDVDDWARRRRWGRRRSAGRGCGRWHATIATRSARSSWG